MLEIGAGTGVHGAFFQKHGLKVTCTDLSPAMVAHMRAMGLDAHEMDFGMLTFPAESFDAVFAMNCLLHVPHADFRPVLAGVDRVLKPGGLFLLCQYGGKDEEGPFADDHYEPKRFYAFWTDEQIKTEVNKVFTIESFRTIEIESDSASKIHSQILVLRK